MPTGWPGGELTRALTRFQKDHELEADGTLLPLGPFGVAENGVGETAQALKLQLFDRLQRHAAPTVAEVDRFYRGRRPGESEPPTDVALRASSDDSSEPIGLKPVMSDETPLPSIKLESEQQLALLRDPRYDPTTRKNLLFDGPYNMGGGFRGSPTLQGKTPAPARPAPGKDIRSPAAPGKQVRHRRHPIWMRHGR